MKKTYENFTDVDFDTMQRYMDDARRLRAAAVRDFFSAPFRACRGDSQDD